MVLAARGARETEDGGTAPVTDPAAAAANRRRALRITPLALALAALLTALPLALPLAGG